VIGLVIVVYVQYREVQDENLETNEEGEEEGKLTENDDDTNIKFIPIDPNNQDNNNFQYNFVNTNENYSHTNFHQNSQNLVRVRRLSQEDNETTNINLHKLHTDLNNVNNNVIKFRRLSIDSDEEEDGKWNK
jgi:hypothetical protein